jgi:hypothetical protein
MFEVPDADDIFKGKSFYDMPDAAPSQEEEDFLFWLGKDDSED